MKNSTLVLNKIQSFYSPRNSKIVIPYETLFSNHLKVIELLKDFWIDINVNQPKNKEPVLGLEDLTTIGKGKFVDEFFYEKNKFVANLGDCDPYGFITHWISISTIDESNIDFNGELSKIN
jgi:hypothetical protein